MPATLMLRSATDTIDLNEVLTRGKGVQATAGAFGLGLPPVSVQWLEGAGDGGVYRGKRVLSRDIDLPLWFQADSRRDLQGLLTRFARVMAGEMTLSLTDDDGSTWAATVHRVGGGDYTYGTDTVGERTFRTVVTLRAGDPYWVSTKPIKQVVKTVEGVGLLPELTKLQLSSGQTFGTILLDNPGDAPAYPIWTITGPGTNFKAVSPSGEVFEWVGSLNAGESLTIDAARGTVVDEAGVSRYADFAAAPRLWRIPPGTNEATVSIDSSVAGTEIECLWYPRKWLVI